MHPIAPGPLDRFIAIAQGPPTTERWQRLFMVLSEWPVEAGAADPWTTRAGEALAGWPTSLRAAIMTDDPVEEHDWMWPVGRETEPVSWLRLVRSLWADPADVLAVPPEGGWARHGLQVVEEFHVRDALTGFADVTAALACLHSLKLLDLSQSAAFGMTVAAVRTGWEQLLQAGAAGGLTALGAAGLPLDSTAWRELAASALASRLRVLDLSAPRARVDSVGVAALAAWPAGDQLAELRVADAVLGDAGALAVWNADALGSLRVLALGGNGLTDAFAENVAAKGRDRLVELDLRNNGLTDRSVDYFVAADLPALRRLHLDDNRLTRAGYARLRQWAASRPGPACTVTPATHRSRH